MKAKVYLEVELPEPKGTFTEKDLYDFISTHLFGGLVKKSCPFYGDVKKIGMFITVNDE